MSRRQHNVRPGHGRVFLTTLSLGLAGALFALGLVPGLSTAADAAAAQKCPSSAAAKSASSKAAAAAKACKSPKPSTTSRTTNELKVALAFVDNSTTSRGNAVLPAGTPIYRPGSTIDGTAGCPTTSFGTDGLMVLVMDYQGAPTSASVTTTITPPEGGPGFEVAPYYLDLNPGQRIQYLGPRNQNGTYDIHIEYGYARSTGFPKMDVRFRLNRSCGA